MSVTASLVRRESHELRKSIGEFFSRLPSMRVVPNMGLHEGIDTLRALLPRCWFDEKKCAAGFEGLAFYQKTYYERLKEFGDLPVRNFATHGADTFRYLAVRTKPAGSERPTYRPPFTGRGIRQGAQRASIGCREGIRRIVKRPAESCAVDVVVASLYTKFGFEFCQPFADDMDDPNRARGRMAASRLIWRAPLGDRRGRHPRTPRLCAAVSTATSRTDVDHERFVCGTGRAGSRVLPAPSACSAQ